MGLTDQVKAKTIELVMDLASKDSALDDRKFPPTKTLQLVASLPKEQADKLNGQFFMAIWDDLPKVNRQYPAMGHRAADGSNYYISNQNLGAANTPYARTITTSHFPVKSELPDAGQLFDDLMKRPDESEVPFDGNKAGVNMLLHSMASVITHDIFKTKPGDPTINQTTSYLDLSCLYGPTKEEQSQIRTGVDGLIKPDVFSDARLQFQLPSTVYLLILFNRNHNYIAKQLLTDAVNVQENYRFTHLAGKDSPRLSAERTDEIVFQTARNINIACYTNVVFHEYLLTILDVDVKGTYSLAPNEQTPKDASYGNVVSAEFSFIYRWHSGISREDADWLKSIPIDKYLKLRKEFSFQLTAAETDGNEAAIQKAKMEHGKAMMGLLPEFGLSKEDYSLGPMCIGYHRDPATKVYSNKDLLQMLTNGMERVTSKMGARKVPESLREIEIEGIESARRQGLCTLNEFRKHFRLKEYNSYEEMITGPECPKADPIVIAALEKHYGKDGINRVEFYPGIVLEATDGEGISQGYSIIRAILADAINLIKNDRFLVYGLNPHELTHWGYNYYRASGDERQDGLIFKKIVLNCFPEWDRPELQERLKNPFRVSGEIHKV
ncbi:hypothetical protein HDU79_004593 [Rhizoclosmatium sp. JEL0117]|nr:hypothetical protein HDU79_004593 [Rhizoclosmatium sp. JEL0117]